MNQSPSDQNPAQTYEDYFVRYMFRPWAEELLDRAKPKAGERVLDLACGTGIVARSLATRLKDDAEISGLDFNPKMIEIARTTSSAEGHQIEYIVGSADALPFPDQTFDLVVCQQGLQFFPDRVDAAREMLRVLKPGGRACVATWTQSATSSFHQEFIESIGRNLGVSTDHLPFSLGDPDELRSIFSTSGFANIRIEYVERTVRFGDADRYVELGIASASAGIAAFQSITPDQRVRLIEAVHQDIGPQLAQYTDGTEIVSTRGAHVALAERPI